MIIDCPCGHTRPFSDCCERFIDGLLTPETAEELMRSRYSAYARGYVDYLVTTHDPKTRVPALRENVAKWATSARFTGLAILDTDAGGADDAKGTVEFEATYVEGGEEKSLRERSRFRRHQGRWVYINGTTPATATVRRETPRVGRNAPCPCGSGKKFKRCCG